jgi:8-oxo-dGTP pyrophosphatase MutT (NUDIX family)
MRDTRGPMSEPEAPGAPPSPPPARPAATALLVRTGARGLEVFMVQRHRRSGFLPNAWVFPGGRVDEADRLQGHPRVGGRLSLTGLSEVGAASYGVAAVRETFEEAGLWVGEGEVPEERRGPLARGEVAVRDLLDEHDARVMLDLLRPWSWWITPVVEPKRFDTRFLVALAPPADGKHDGGETVDSRWIEPREVLADHELRTFPLAPPTWWTLRELAAYDTAEAAFEAARTGPAVPIQPVMRFVDNGLDLLLPGHPDHGAPAIEGLPDRITHDRGAWVAWTGEDRLPVLPDRAG